jgi:predicted nucleic acid-binding protein
VLDTGALIGLERGDERMTALLAASLRGGVRFLVPAAVLAQAWRDGARQTRLARLLGMSEVEVLPLSAAHARAAGALCGLAGTSDVVDASVIIAAREHKAPVVTGDPDDLTALDPSVLLHTL